MKHQKKERELGRTKNQRKALKKTLLGSLIMREKIATTEAKAKEVKKMIDRLISRAKVAQEKEKRASMLRYLSTKIDDKSVQKITSDFIKKFESRDSGYTRIIKNGVRKSDNAKMAILEFVE